MFSILKQFRASIEMDAKNPRRAASEDEPGGFARVDTLLRNAPSGMPIPQDLHPTVMQAVRAEAASDAGSQISRAGGWVRGWAAPALALGAACLALVVWSGLRGVRTKPIPTFPGSQPSMEAASTALDLSRTWPATLPTTITAPMTDEWERINLDIAATKRTLLATFP
jgi:hypothetical protein